MTKTVKLPKESIYLVVKNTDYEGYDVLCAFKTRQSAEKFVKHIKDVFKKDKKATVKIGQYELDDIKAYDLQVLIYTPISDVEDDDGAIPFFNK